MKGDLKKVLDYVTTRKGFVVRNVRLIKILGTLLIAALYANEDIS